MRVAGSSSTCAAVIAGPAASTAAPLKPRSHAAVGPGKVPDWHGARGTLPIAADGLRIPVPAACRVFRSGHGTDRPLPVLLRIHGGGGACVPALARPLHPHSARTWPHRLAAGRGALS